MKVALLVSALLAVSSAKSDILGMQRCTWGPDYWCSHIRHAKQCGTFDHCMEKVWKNKEIQVETSAECSFCEMLVYDIRMKLQAKSTQDEIEKYMSKACNVLPAEEMRSECSNLVNDYLPEILQLMEAQLDDKVVCSTLGLCKAKKPVMFSVKSLKDKPSRISVMKASNDTVCTDCKKFIGDLQDMITSTTTQEDLEQLIDAKICTLLPGELQGVCKQLVQQYVPVFLQMLKNQLDPDLFCTTIGFCHQNIERALKFRHHFLRLTKKVSGSETCELCKTVATELQALDRNKDIQTEIKSVFENKICPELGKYAEECKNLIDEYADTVFELIAAELDPATFCVTIGLCSQPGQVSLHKNKPMKKIIQSTPCEFCTMAIGWLDNLLKDQTVDGDIQKFLDQLCNYLPSEYKDQCTEYVNNYSEIIIQLIEQALDDPTAFCKEFGLCQSKITKNKSMKKSQSTPCEVCTMAIGWLDNLLKDQTVDGDIKKALDQLCNYLPSEYKDKCTEYVNNYSEIIIQLIEQALDDPTAFCKQFGLCQAKKTAMKMIEVKSAVTCEVCQVAMTYLDQILGNNRTEEAVKKALEQLCGYLPSTFQNECKLLVDTYGDRIIELLVDELANPDQICKELGLCDSANMKSPSEYCVLCEFVMKELANLLKTNATQKEIEDALAKVCGIMPSSLKSQCTVFVEEYGPVIVQMLAAELDPKQICTTIGVCSGKFKVMKPVLSALLMRGVPIGQKKIKHVKSAGVLCEECTMVLNFVKEELSDNKTVEKLEKYLEELCDKFAEPAKTACDDAVKNYAKVIASMIVKYLDPQQDCTSLGLCSATKHVLLGSDKCSYGPSYWCYSMLNAKECQTVDHCQKHVWNKSRPT